MWVPCKCTVIRNNSQFWREHQSLSHSKSYFWEKDCIQFTLKLHTRCSTVWVVVVVVVVTSALALIALETACFPNSVRWRRPLLWVSPIQTPSLQSTCRWCAWWLCASNGRDVTWTAWKIWCPVVMVFWVKFKVIEFVAQCQLMNQVNPHIQQTVKDQQWPQGQCRWHVKKELQFVSCTLPFSCYKKQLELGGFNQSLWLPLQVERLLGAVPSPLNWLFAWESKSIIKQHVNLEPAKPLMNQGWSHLCWYMMH